MEEEDPKDNARFFLQKMYTMKHSIYQLFRYYQQLTELADDLMEWEGGFLDPGEMECFSRFITRTKRLADDMEIMRGVCHGDLGDLPVADLYPTE